MRIELFGKTIFETKATAPVIEQVEETIQPQASYLGWGGYNYNNPIFPRIYDGEKNMGEMGPIYQYFLAHYQLRARSRQLYLESEICQTVIRRYTQWVIGSGLLLQAEPQKDVLKSKGINIDTEVFNKSVESYWKVYANSKMADATGKKTLNGLQAEAETESKIGGDMLVLLSVVKGIVKVRHIDGSHVMTPPYISSINGDSYAENGNRVRWGIEIDANGKQVAFYVRACDGITYERIEAIGRKSGMVMAYMIFGFKYTIDSERGMPLLVAVMETAKKLERYNSAALASAEERQKIPYFFEHGVTSTNEDPQLGIRAKITAGRHNIQADTATTINGDQLASKVAASTNKQVYNLPNDVSVKSLESKQELHVSEFSMLHVDLICATVGIPPNVAMSKYEDSFSASRMAGKDWEHTFMLERKTFSQQYLDPIYALQVYVWVHSNEIQAPGYLTAFMKGDEMAINAYLYARWVGDSFPDIDPLKTAKYLREMTGPTLAHIPFMTPESATEYMGQGSSDAIMEQVSKDLELAEKLGIEREDLQTGVPETNESDDTVADKPKVKTKTKK